MPELVVACLGNPGARYAATRHNVGWLVAQRLVDRLDARPLEQTASYAAFTAVAAPDRPWTIVLPLLYMNRSGEGLLEFRAQHAFDPAGCLVVVDDVWLPPGAIRLRARGSAGGHNGLASVEAALGTDDYPRLRIGVGRGDEAIDLADHVLAEFDEDERPALEESLQRSADAALAWVAEGITAAMNRFNVPAREARDNAPQGER
jgi:PTH1 family peptidyl-tRNA hydrolase